ncbi:Rec8 like protein-domain-containing protein [Peziza echinospora]|nr:Rec8 like protein-domain-containing protein [Peziza echinospora]
MFYSTEILTERKYGVATVWLVATLGQKSRHLRVQRKDILSVDVPKACGTIINPEVPFALRLQSSLLYGVTKCFSQQYHYFLQDVTHVHTCVRRTYSSTTANPELLNLTATATKTRDNQLVLADDPAFLPDIDPRGLEDIVDLDIQILRIDDDSMLGSASHTQSSSGPGSVASRKSLTFQRGAPNTQVSSSSAGIASPAIGIGNYKYDEELPPPLDFEFGGDGDAIYNDSVNVNDMLSTPIRPVKAATRHAKEGRERLESDSFAIGQVENDHEGALQRRMSLGDRDDIADFQEDVMDVDTEQHTAHGQALLAQDDSMLALDDPDVPFENDEENVTPKKEEGKKRGRPRKLILTDESTQLKRATLAQWNEEYCRRMDEERKKKEAHKRVNIMKDNAKNMMTNWGIGGELRNPILKMAFSGKALIEKFNLLKAGKNTASGVKRPAMDDAEEGRRVRPRAEDDNLLGDDFEAALHFNEDSLEVARNEPSAMADESRASIMPWDMFSVKGSQLGRNAQSLRSSSSVGGELMMSGGSRGLHSSRIDTGSLPGRGRRISASPLADRGRFSVLEEDSWDSGQFGTEDEDRYLGSAEPQAQGDAGFQDSFEFFGPAARTDTAMAETAEFLEAQLENEAHNFLSFVRTKATQSAGEGQDLHAITFMELIPPAKNTNIVATQAFLQTLTLAKMGLIVIKQEPEFDSVIHILVKG